MSDKTSITTILVLANCRASGEALTAGKTYKVPADVSAHDAVTLVQMGRAEDVSNADVISRGDFADAIACLEEGNEAHWTVKGLPEVGALKEAGLKGMSAEMRNSLWAEYQEANA